MVRCEPTLVRWLCCMDWARWHTGLVVQVRCQTELVRRSPRRQADASPEVVLKRASVHRPADCRREPRADLRGRVAGAVIALLAGPTGRRVACEPGASTDGYWMGARCLVSGEPRWGLVSDG